MNNLQWLENWFVAQCNGDWEHQYGIKIDTLDNPAWKIEIDLTETSLADSVQKFPLSLVQENNPNDWFSVKIENQRFIGVGDKQKLDFLIQQFRLWVEQVEAKGI